MATSNGAPPSTSTLDAGVGTSLTGINPNGTLAPAPAASTPATPAGPQGPNAAGLNPGAMTPAPTDVPQLGSIPTVTLPDNIASQKLIGGSVVAGTKGEPAKPARQYDEKQLVTELAGELGVKKPADGTLEQAVIDDLAKKYGVKILRGSGAQGTGRSQGEVGGLRHDIASWFDDASSEVNKAAAPVGDLLIPGQYDKATAEPDRAGDVEAAMKIKNPKLREQALARANGTSPIAQVRQQNQNQIPDQSSAALSQMLGNVAEKMGINASVEGQTGLSQIAAKEGLPTESGATSAMPGTGATTQTAAQAWLAFTQQAFTKTGTLTADGQAWVTDLENSGFLDSNYGNDVTQGKGANASLGKAALPANAILQAYNDVLTNAVNNKTNLNAALQAGPTAAQSTQNQTGTTSEMEAYVQGVATEFGVGLTPQELAKISNQYGASASTAADPSSVEDQIKDAVIQYYDPDNPNNPPGVANTMFTDIQAQALAYQIPISKAAIGNMVKTAMQGATVESMYVAADAAQSAATETFQQQAAGLYPTLAPQIAAGNTVQNLVAPYFQVAEQYTGVPSSTMMADQQKGGVSKWGQFLQGAQDPKTGAPAMQTLDQWKKTLMQDPKYGFQKTQGAQDMAEQMSSAILNEFGKVDTNGGSSSAFNSFSPQQALEANTT